VKRKHTGNHAKQTKETLSDLHKLCIQNKVDTISRHTFD